MLRRFASNLEVIRLRECVPADWSTTEHTKKQRGALSVSIARFGMVQPFSVRKLPQHPKGIRYETIDGSARLRLLVENNPDPNQHVSVMNYGVIDDETAYSLHVALNMDRGAPAPGPLADLLENVLACAKDDKARTQTEVELLALLPKISSGGVDGLVQRLRRRAAPKPMKHDPNAPRGWVDFHFKVHPDAANVCDQALSSVESTTQCKRSIAFERICADHLAGPMPGRQV